MRLIVFTHSLISVCDNTGVSSREFSLESLDLNAELNRADAVLVQGWESPQLVAAIGRHRVGSGGYWLFFQDTDDRLSRPAAVAAYELRFYDGVLVSNESLRQEYARHRWVRRALAMPDFRGYDVLGTAMRAQLLALTQQTNVGRVA